MADTVPVFDTGVDGAGKVLAPGNDDPHWTIQQVPSGSVFSAPGAARVAAAHFAYIQNDAVGSVGSSWIAPSQDTDDFHATGVYRYRTTFDLTGLDPATAVIAGSFACDNTVEDVLLNGTSIGVHGGSFQAFFVSFTLTSGFVEGTNTLDFVVDNAGADANPHGLRVRLDGTADPAVPADTTAPQFSGVTDFTFECTGSDISLDAASLGISATDDVDGAVAVSLSLSSVSDLGTYEVTASASDAAGNTATATFAVDVVDTTAPTVTSIASQSEASRHGWRYALKVAFDVSATDACDPEPSSRIVAVQVDDAQWSNGCGADCPDFEVIDDLTVVLRTDRWGRWSGRTFMVTIETADDSEHVTTSTVAIAIGRDSWTVSFEGSSARKWKSKSKRKR